MDRPPRVEGDKHTGRKRQPRGWGEGGKRHSKKTVAETLIFPEPLLCARPTITVKMLQVSKMQPLSPGNSESSLEKPSRTYLRDNLMC